ncbi:15476_t:CDS:2, partial [Cetraspora pellucida]
KTFKKAKEIIEDIIDNNMSEDEVIVKHAKNNSQWLGGARKSNLVQKLFSSEFYLKKKSNDLEAI